MDIPDTIVYIFVAFTESWLFSWPVVIKQKIALYIWFFLWPVVIKQKIALYNWFTTCFYQYFWHISTKWWCFTSYTKLLEISVYFFNWNVLWLCRLLPQLWQRNSTILWAGSRHLISPRFWNIVPLSPQIGRVTVRNGWWWHSELCNPI